jgi:hypothetical protein
MAMLLLRHGVGWLPQDKRIVVRMLRLQAS